jgi:hypothetical protein
MNVIAQGLIVATFALATYSATAQFVNTRMVEFYHPDLDHYFYTVADSAEANWVESGGAGAAWRKTGWVFSGTNALVNGANTFCRFYGSLNPGPNSHFYTVDEEECRALRELAAVTPKSVPRWNFEGSMFVYFFYFTRSVDRCSVPETSQPFFPRILRFYNEGFSKGKDSNHRFVAETATTAIADMIARGWKNEGVVMCGTGVSGPQ